MSWRLLKNPEQRRGGLLLGFGTLFWKELQEWRQKPLAIAFFLAVTLLIVIGNIALSLITVPPAPEAMALRVAALTDAATVYAKNFIWIMLISIFVSMGLIVNEQESGTLAWNLTKPLSRPALLLAKWIATTLMVWLLGVATQSGAMLAVEASQGVAEPNWEQIAWVHLGALGAIGFWVLLCLLLGTLFKEQAAVGAGALLVGLGPLILSNFPGFLQFLVQIYPTTMLGWAMFTPPNLGQLIGYLAWMAAMAIATLLIFNQKEI
jgi:ABC-type transport system involved in multi-copper enzyme maturation permease subunit